ncbi:transporter [Leptospira perolatii]|uniref:Transporter n=1 Tax=Leptospira perolatii TaxID=2023191 RepID=A0A2M9ZP45_9LEPT|nr:bile acid:sodium symporter family protein [Leptospira perolatii]PJZ70647.1 transporter [Leptospira perolatii]PJZ73858.1 transporter [Leptospira perolatii]
MEKIFEKASLLFPLWVLLGAILSWILPEWISWFQGPWITYGLGITMLGMGITLVPDDFKRIASAPKPVLIGVLAQYTVMPISGWVIGNLGNLPEPLATGLILVSCCPGGVASNVITFLARGDVALSVTMTAISTLLAVVMTPALTLLLVGSTVPVKPEKLFLSTFEVILLPVILGLLLNVYLPRAARTLKKVSPLVAVVLITLIVSSVIGSSKQSLLESGGKLVVCVFLLHISGYFFGYWIGKWSTRNSIFARTISIEVGMQNSALGVALAQNNFQNPIVAVPAALSSFVHSVIGSILAGIWRRTARSSEEEISEVSVDLP